MCLQLYSKSSKRERQVIQNPARERDKLFTRERDKLFKIQQERDTRYSKSSKRERDDLFKIQQEREKGGIQNPARERDRERGSKELLLDIVRVQ